MVMMARNDRDVCAVMSSLAFGLFVGCGGGTAVSQSDAAILPASSDATVVQTGVDAATGSGGTSGASPTPQRVTFTYTPGWQGVTSVDVIGGFGKADDWMTAKPFLKLGKLADGSYAGTTDLPAGTYIYLFRVLGDAAMGPKAQQFSVDPINPAFASCPDGSPAFRKTNPQNPCSQLTVPQPAGAPLFAVTGSIYEDGKPKAGYRVELHRMEKGTHHYFANGTTTDAKGAFAIMAAAAGYQIHIQHPSLAATTDVQRDPMTLQAVRRLISAQFALTGDLALVPLEAAYHDYAQMLPAGGTMVLPGSFMFTVIAGSTGARLAIYGMTGAGQNIGDPWFTSPYAKATSVAFDGKFDTTHAADPIAIPGKQYYWGTWEELAKRTDGGPTWSTESMVLPIKF